MRKRSILAGAFAGVLSLGVVQSAFAGQGRVTAGVLNVREQPSTEAAINATLNAGNVVDIISEEGEWYKVNVGGTECYVHSDYVVAIGEGEDAGSEGVNSVISAAVACIGVKYRYGGESMAGFDCSGFVRYVFRNAVGHNLPRTTYEQVKSGYEVGKDEMRAGDLLFFSRTNHVGIYMGDGTYIHSPQTGRSVSIDPLNRPVENVRRIISE